VYLSLYCIRHFGRSWDILPADGSSLPAEIIPGLATKIHEPIVYMANITTDKLFKNRISESKFIIISYFGNTILH
jgi:hypothetical protein